MKDTQKKAEEEFNKTMSYTHPSTMREMMNKMSVAELKAMRLHLEGDDNNAGTVLQEASIPSLANFFMKNNKICSDIALALKSSAEALDGAFVHLYCQCYYSDKTNQFDHNGFLKDLSDALIAADATQKAMDSFSNMKIG